MDHLLGAVRLWLVVDEARVNDAVVCPLGGKVLPGIGNATPPTNGVTGRVGTSNN